MENSFAQHTPLILIVDDIPRNLQVLSNILNNEGYNISFASSGKQALSVLESAKPDLILLDIMMPEMDGYQVCTILKEDENYRDIPIIFLTGKAEIEDVIKGLKLGAVDYITKPFNATELLTRVKNHLELKIARDTLNKQNKELREVRDTLKQTNASKDKFFSIIAHDLRGPFSGFLGLSELLKDEYEGMEPEDIANIATSMNKAAKRLFNLLENLLDWSRAQMDRIEYRPGRMEIRDAVYKVLFLFKANADDKHIDLISEIEDEVFVYSDANLLNTILRNLLSNALKFTPNSGKVVIDCKAQDDKLLSVSVTDSGVGMSDDVKSKLFRIDEKKVSTPGTNNEQGTGLGLLLCRELVEKSGGNMTFESEIGKGTKFTFTLPLYAEQDRPTDSN